MTAPVVWPRTGSSGDALQTALEHVRNEAIGLTASGADLLPAYQRWAVSAVTRLRPHLASDDVDRLIRTATFWAAMELDPHASVGGALISGELAVREEELGRAGASIESFRRRFADVPEAAIVLVPDTNVLIAHAEEARTADWRGMLRDQVRDFDILRVVIPLVVIDELDRLKQSSKQATRTRARLMLKLIHELLVDRPDGRRTLQDASGEHGEVTVEVLMESSAHVRLTRADDELIDVVARLRDMLGPRTVIVTFDTGADFRAAARSLRHVHLEHAYR
ncbi:hypothetical protein E9529_20250 [Blastococcus sp. KM273128]|jgi:rRNA-processing protein FCF1|uniref:PIN domain-containing protein n=1 Tax=Blastococcus sp. KM273128 TaxID=2570314 RepID=UPI001F2E7D91|nr:PIN domain-containing protein [Blastococcus sp. KM273128]MCF6746564.1 hypothetical protein [Blastococcus sp. KM273128]